MKDISTLFQNSGNCDWSVCAQHRHGMVAVVDSAQYFEVLMGGLRELCDQYTDTKRPA